MTIHLHTHTSEELLHTHEFTSHNHEGERRTAWVMGLTIVTMIAEILTGWMSGSMALMADGWHMGTHAAALGIAWAAFVFTRKHARNPRFTFGTGKVGILSAFGSSIILAGIAFLMLWESGLRLLTPITIRYNEALLVATIGLIVNLVSAWLLGHSHTHHSDASAKALPHDHNMRAAYTHVMADALTSVLAISALLAARQWHWLWADPLMGILGGILILRWSWSLARETGHILVDGDIPPEEPDAIRRIIESDGDSKVTDLHIWRVGATEKAAIISLVNSLPKSPSDYRAMLSSFEDLKHISIEVNVCSTCVTKPDSTTRLP